VSLERKGASLTCNEQKLAVSNSFSRLQHCAALHCAVAQGCSKLEVQHCVSVSVRGGTCLGLVESGRCCKKLERIDQQRGWGQSWAAADEERGPDCMDVENDPGANNADGLYRERRWSRQCQQQVGVGVGGEARGGR
jgi:hypothetical protein